MFFYGGASFALFFGGPSFALFFGGPSFPFFMGGLRSRFFTGAFVPAFYRGLRSRFFWGRLAGDNLPVRLIFAFLLLWSATAPAACPGDAGELLPPRAELPALEKRLAGLAAECGGQPGYLAYRGAVLNALGRPAEAAALLEAALLIDPARAGAQIDYAESLAALGDSTAAAALLRDLLARPDVPAQLRPLLEQRLNAVEALRRFDTLAGLRAWVGTDWRREFSVTLRAGYDSNLNSAPSRDALTLTLPGGDAVLLLADRFRARSGSATLADASAYFARPLEGGAALQFYGEARARASSSVSDTNYQQGQAVGAYSHPLATGDALFSFGATQLRYGGQELYRAVRVAAGRDWRQPRCRPRLGIESEWRSYPPAPELDGHFLGAGAGVACLFGLNRLTVAVRGGEDSAESDRPGGDQRQADLRVAWIGPLRGGSLTADLLLSRQQDASGFSPLLENNATRRLDRFNLHLEYAYPVAPGWSLLASFDSTLQRSNLPLFDISGQALYLGVRWRSQR